MWLKIAKVHKKTRTIKYITINDIESFDCDYFLPDEDLLKFRKNGNEYKLYKRNSAKYIYVYVKSGRSNNEKKYKITEMLVDVNENGELEYYIWVESIGEVKVSGASYWKYKIGDVYE